MLKVGGVFLCLAIVVLAACAAPVTVPVKTEVPVTVTCDQFQQQPKMVKDATMKVGDKLVLTLCANPTTGFQWNENAQVSDPQVLKQVNYNFAAPGSSLPGAPGNAVWTFEALQNGVSNVNLEYSRSWEGGEKGVQTLKLAVTVK